MNLLTDKEEKIETFPTKPIEPIYCKKEGHTLQWARSNGDVYCENCYLENVILL